MTNFIRFSAGVAAAIVFWILAVAIFGAINHRKAVAVVFLDGVALGAGVFGAYAKKILVSPTQRVIALAGAVFLYCALIYAQADSGIFAVGSRMIGHRWATHWGYWVALLIANFLPFAAFYYDRISGPLAKWITTGESRSIPEHPTEQPQAQTEHTAAQREFDREAVKPMGVCPNCRNEIPLDSVVCLHCRALFGGSSAWKIELLAKK